MKEEIAIFAAAVLIGAGGAVASERDKPVCFPAKKWSGSDAQRPCAEITRVYEDGSLRLRVLDADGETRYSKVVGARG